MSALFFSKLINEVESAISMEYLPDCIAWADKTHNNAWSNAIERFENALSEDIATRAPDDKGNTEFIYKEAEIYKNTCLGLIKEFKPIYKIKETDVVENSIRLDTWEPQDNLY